MHRVLLSYLEDDWVPILSNIIRAIGFLLNHLMTSGCPSGSPVSFPPPLCLAFAKTRNHTSNEVKKLVAQTTHYLGRHPKKFPPKFIEVLTPHLVNAILEEKTDVQSA